MMKRIVSTVLSVALFLVMCVSSVAADETGILLSNLTPGECIAFLKEAGVDIPDDYEDELEWGTFAKDIIQAVEVNPSITFAFNYSVTQSFANAIKKTVNEYYGVGEVRQVGANTRVIAPTLIYSEVYGAWKPEYEKYNCYSYALGITDDWLDPGNKSGFVYTVNLSVYTIADYVKADLEKMDCTDVTISATSPTASSITGHQKAICVRNKGGVDYHFMKLENGVWYHKPSYTNPLKYLHQPSESLNWTNECSYENVVYLATIEYSSAIRYITYTAPCEYSYVHCGSSAGANYHILTCSICNKTTGSKTLCVYKNGSTICTICGHNKNAVATSLSVNLYDKVA